MIDIDQHNSERSSGETDASTDKKHGLIAQALMLSSLNLLSPVFGMLAEIVLAWRFGMTGLVDAYRVTVLLLIYGQQLFVASILPYVLVPVFAECRSQGREADAWRMSDSVGRVVLLFGVLIAGFLFFRPELAVSLVAPGLSSEVRHLAIYLMRWCGLAFIPMCWTGVACGVLYAYDVFQIAALAQLTSNIVLVLAIGIGGAWMGAASLATGVVGGALASTCVYTYKLIRIRRQFGPKGNLLAIDLQSVRKAARIAVPLLGSVIAVQVTSIVVNRALSRLPEGTLAAFGYAWKLCALVVVIPTALATVLFPKFSASWYSDDRENFPFNCAKALRAALFIAVPLMCVCCLFRREIVTLLFQRGAFTLADADTASLLFSFLILNGPAIAVTTTLARIFYAIQAARFPVITDVGGSCMEIVLVPWLASRFGASGAASGYTLLPWVTGTGLLGIFKWRFRTFPIASIGMFLLNVVAVGLLSAGAGWLVGHFLGAAVPGGTLYALVCLGSGGLVTLLLYYAGTVFLNLPEAVLCTGFMRKTGQLAWSYVSTLQ